MIEVGLLKDIYFLKANSEISDLLISFFVNKDRLNKNFK